MGMTSGTQLAIIQIAKVVKKAWIYTENTYIGHRLETSETLTWNYQCKHIKISFGNQRGQDI